MAQQRTPRMPILRVNHPQPSSHDMTSKGAPTSVPPPPWTGSIAPPWLTGARPLSDIREITEPSLLEVTNRNIELARKASLKRNNSLKRKESLTRNQSLSGLSRKGSSNGSIRGSQAKRLADIENAGGPTVSPESQTDQSSAYSLSLENVPPRSSSKHILGVGRDGKLSRLRKNKPRLPKVPPRGVGHTIPNRGSSNSPVKHIITRLETLMDQGRRIPSRTFIRTSDPNTDVLEYPSHRHPRMSAELQVGASLFVGGGSIEGHVRIVVDELERVRHRRQLAISRVSIDLLGAEEMSGAKRAVFLNLATELIDSDNPPPHNMVESLKQISPIDPFWLLAPSSSNLPFMISLPLDVGPPPFHSKHARIRYILSATLLIRDQGKQYLIRTSQEIAVISVYDPEKALMSLPSPLTASDQYTRHRENNAETVKVTAGLHRQVWVSGTSIFVDVHVANNSKKIIKRVEMQLERDILCYKHAAASTLERSASQARIFDFNERSILSKNVLKSSGTSGWGGIFEHSSDIRTFDLELPRGHATVKCGKFFEVRYFLNIIVGTSSKPKLVTVQLPIVLIHMNSLDVVPNSVAQVAAAIEEKRARTRREMGFDHGSTSETPAGGSPHHRRRGSSTTSVQGRAFAAPRKQSLDRMRAEQEDWIVLGRVLESSPRKHRSPPKRPTAAAQHQPHRSAHHGQSLSRPTPPPLSVPPPPPPRFHLSERPPQQGEEYTYRTPPSSNRKGRVLVEDRPHAEDARERLRRMRSADQARSTTSLRRANSMPAPAGHAGQSKKAALHKIGLSGLAFDVLESGAAAAASAAPAALPTNPGEPATVASPTGGGNGGRYAHFRRMRSGDRWRPGGGWFAEKSRERDKYRDKENRAKMMGNWI